LDSQFARQPLITDVPPICGERSAENVEDPGPFVRFAFFLEAAKSLLSDRRGPAYIENLLRRPGVLRGDRQHKVRWSFCYPLVPGNKSSFAAAPASPRPVARVVEKIFDRLE